jgi:hypothetical protein
VCVCVCVCVRESERERERDRERKTSLCSILQKAHCEAKGFLHSSLCILSSPRFLCTSNLVYSPFQERSQENNARKVMAKLRNQLPTAKWQSLWHCTGSHHRQRVLSLAFWSSRSPQARPAHLGNSYFKVPSPQPVLGWWSCNLCFLSKNLFFRNDGEGQQEEGNGEMTWNCGKGSLTGTMQHPSHSQEFCFVLF